MSKPKKENKSYYTSEQLAQVEALAAHGHTLEAIAKYLGVSTRTIFYAKLENKELEAAYERGKFKAQSFVAKGLFSFINQEDNEYDIILPSLSKINQRTVESLLDELAMKNILLTSIVTKLNETIDTYEELSILKNNLSTYYKPPVYLTSTPNRL